MWTYVIASFLSLLPGRWRRALFGEVGFNWPRATALSGMMESVLCFGGLIAWYFHVMYSSFNQQVGATVQATQGAPGEGAAFAMGAVGLFYFAMHPVTWVLAYFTVEGIWRTLAATDWR